MPYIARTAGFAKFLADHPILPEFLRPKSGARKRAAAAPERPSKRAETAHPREPSQDVEMMDSDDDKVRIS